LQHPCPSFSPPRFFGPLGFLGRFRFCYRFLSYSLKPLVPPHDSWFSGFLKTAPLTNPSRAFFAHQLLPSYPVPPGADPPFHLFVSIARGRSAMPPPSSLRFALDHLAPATVSAQAPVSGQYCTFPVFLLMPVVFYCPDDAFGFVALVKPSFRAPREMCLLAPRLGSYIKAFSNGVLSGIFFFPSFSQPIFRNRLCFSPSFTLYGNLMTRPFTSSPPTKAAFAFPPLGRNLRLSLTQGRRWWQGALASLPPNLPLARPLVFDKISGIYLYPLSFRCRLRQLFAPKFRAF